MLDVFKSVNVSEFDESNAAKSGVGLNDKLID